jgi:flagellar basal body-associated protein FliL
MKKQSSALFWALGFLALIIASIAFFYVWQNKPHGPQVQAPIFVNVGDIDAYIGGKRLVKASVVLEVSSKKAQAKITEGMARAKISIINSFHSISERRIKTTEGKHELLELIRDDLNDLFGPRAISEVFFTNLVISIS